MKYFRRVGKIVKSDYYHCHLCPSLWNDSANTGRIFMKFDECFFENPRWKERLIKIWLYMETDIHLWSYLLQFLSKWEIFQKKKMRREN